MGKNRSYADEIDHRIGAMEVKLDEYRIARKVLAELSGSADPEIEIEHQPVANGNGKMPLVTISRQRQPEPPPKPVKRQAPSDPKRAAREREAVRQVMTAADTVLPIGSQDLSQAVRQRLGYEGKSPTVGWAMKYLRDTGEIVFNADEWTYNLPG